MFEMKLRYFEHSVSFVQKYKITGKTYKIAGYMEYGACNDEMCMPPSSVEFSYSGNGPADAPAATENTAAKEGENEIGEVAAAPGATQIQQRQPNWAEQCQATLCNQQEQVQQQLQNFGNP